MKEFWKPILEPLLVAAAPKVIAEVGCYQGDTTRHLVDFCTQRHCDLHVIDPAPQLNPDELRFWRAQPDFGFMLHEARSLEVLPTLSRVDVALLDGDHNWYTVYHELQALEKGARERSGTLPLIVLHDVGWPYGRRDLYYDPASVPREQRQPYSQGGMYPKFSGLTGGQGLNVGANHAEREGGEQNGVLTAIEDYLKTTAVEYQFTVIPLFHGLGILCPASLLAANEQLASFWEDLDRRIVEGGLLEAAEGERIQLGIELKDVRRILDGQLECFGRQSTEADLLPALERALELLFQSRRWRIGCAVVDGLRGLVGKKKTPAPVEAIRQILDLAKERRRQNKFDPSTAERPELAPVQQAVRGPASAYVIKDQLLRQPKTQEEVIRDFHQLYYVNEQRTWRQTFWLGTQVLKCPLDLWLYQEIIHETKPDLIIETGTYHGGSALFLASVCDQVGHGEVLTIDLLPVPHLPSHARIEYLSGNSVDAELLRRIENRARQAQRVMVVLDSDHRFEHVLAELRAFAPLVTQDCYLIVEDTNVNGHPVSERHGPGPREAVQAFLEESRDFTADREKERFFMTFNPGGYLRRVTPRPRLKGEEKSLLARLLRK